MIRKWVEEVAAPTNNRGQEGTGSRSLSESYYNSKIRGIVIAFLKLYGKQCGCDDCHIKKVTSCQVHREGADGNAD